ncbi:nucleotide exchange factor GrpE [Synechocystis sp. LKSZ1]|uniref:nucleotide exchange factor GrpE n=1 Tax=Synechocystis sp. LKSZ1 TaxID=3144951 RepID=UPI00336BBB3B
MNEAQLPLDALDHSPEEILASDEASPELPEPSPSDSAEVTSHPEDSVEEGEPATSPEQIIATLQGELASHRQELAQQAEQLELYKKRYMGLAAEFDNFRKRTQREREDLEKQVKGKTITELLNVVDNFERARTQLKPSTEGEMEIHKSYQSVYKSFVDSLKRLGVTAMRPEGQAFDPNYHEAMLREATDAHPEGTVIEQLVRGYLLEDFVLRHAMVKVAAPKEDVITSDATSLPEDAAPAAE